MLPLVRFDVVFTAPDQTAGAFPVRAQIRMVHGYASP